MRWLAPLILVLAMAPIPAHASTSMPPPGPSDPAAAIKAGRDAGPEPVTAQDTTSVSYRVYATQYNPNTSGSVEVAVPDKCAKFASLGLTSQLSSANCPSGYSTSMNWSVVVKRDSGQQEKIRVKDVGPWNEDDNYWDPATGPRPRRLFQDLSRGTPEAQAAFYSGYHTVSNCIDVTTNKPSGHAGAADQFGRCVVNPAGIDLSVAAAAKLGIANLANEWVTVTFLWERRKLPPQPNILWHNTTSGKSTLWLMSRTKKVGAARIPALAPPWTPVATGDFNGDRHTDVLWWNTSDNRLVELLMNGTKKIGRAVVKPGSGGFPSTAWVPFAVDDFNRDGHPDVAWYDTTNAHVSIWYLRGATHKSSALLTGAAWPTSDWSPFATGRFNADKIPDIAWHSSSTGHVMIWFMSATNGATVSSDQTVTATSWPSPATWTPAGAGDFNRDGHVDLLWHNTSSGSLVVWLMDGGAMTSSAPVTAPSFPAPVNVPIVWR